MRCGAVVGLFFTVAIFAVFFLESSASTNMGTPGVLVFFDFLFIGGASIAVAVVSAKSYLESGAKNILILGSAFLASGSGALIAGLTSSFSMNIYLTIFSVSILTASLLQVISAVSSVSVGISQPSHRFAYLSIAFIGVAVFIIAISSMFGLGYLPIFLSLVWPEIIYVSIMGLTMFFLAVSSIIFGWHYLQSKSTTLYWYSLALGLIALGLFGFLFESNSSGILSWLTRGALYASSFYFCVALFDLNTKMAGVGFSERWADAFRPDRKQISTIFARMLSPFIYGKVVADKAGKPVDCIILDVNAEFERIMGLRRDHIIGKKVSMVLRDVNNSAVSWVQAFNQVAITGESLQFDSYIEPMKKWFSISTYSPQKCYFIATLEDITKRKTAETALRLNEEKYRTLFESMSEGFTLGEVILEIEGKPYDYRILEINAAQEKLMNLPREKIIGQTIRDLDPKVAQKWIDTLGEVALTGAPLKFEEYNPCIDKWFQFYIYSPKKGYCAIITTDTTERKKAEAFAKKAMTALEKERDLFQAVMNGTRRANLAYLDKNFNFVRVNKAYAETCGYSPEEMIGKNYFALYPDKGNEEIFIKVRETGKPVEYHDKPFIFPDQPERGVTYWDWTLEPVNNGNGEVDGLVLSLTETTGRKQVAEELRRSEANLAEAQQMAHMGSWEWDIATDEAVWSDEMFRIFNVKPQYRLHKNFVSWVHPEDLGLVNSTINHCMTTGRSISMDFRIIRSDGAERTIHMEAKVSSFNISGKPAKLVGIVQDITQQKMLENELQNYAKNLEQIIEDRTKKLQDAERLATIGATAGMVGHDIRNPLQSITSNIYLIKNELVDLPQTEGVRDIKECLEEIGKSIDYVNKIVSDLQDYARPLTPKIEEVNLANIVRSVISTIKVPQTITVKQFIPQDMPKIRVDQLYMRRILQNLTINAIQAMPNGGELTIAAGVKDDKALIVVEDTGEGIPEEARDKLFTPLFTTKSKGQGFGLAVVKRLTEAMNGKITFESEVGKGTKFLVELPIYAANGGS